jgi:uncharacterized DUF497 family protein
MRWEWDPVKDAENRRKHGLRLEQGIDALMDPDLLSWVDQRFDYGEERILNLGRVSAEVRFVVITEVSDQVTRIISVRRAEKHEEYWYYHGLP